jgi:hypothetical protein
MVSLWAGVAKPDLKILRGVDILKEMCGVDHYDLDFQDIAHSSRGFRTAKPFDEVVGKISYAGSFLPAASRAAASRGIDRVYWVVAQFDFAYHPERVQCEVWPDPVFVGMFAWSDAGEA